jgi:hypothetical protein
MPVMIRVDDFPFTKEDEWRSGQHSIDKFMEFDSIIPVKYLLGVIPFHCLNFSVWPISAHVVPGIHGYWHAETRQNEFVGYSRNDIAGYIMQGRDVIESVLCRKANIYMPPHNVIDLETIMACRVAGISGITGGPETDRIIPLVANHYGMRYIGSQRSFYGRSDELLQAGADAELNQVMFNAVLTLHWTWENNIGFDHLRRFIDVIGESLVDFDATKIP